MKTHTLMDMLARGAGPAPRGLALRRLTPALALGLLLGLGASVLLLGSIPAALWQQPGPWVKLAYAGALGATAVVWAARLGRPGMPSRLASWTAGGVVVLMLVLGGVSLLAVPASDRLSTLLGHSWAVCPFNVMALSLPALAAALWALRGLAPTDGRRSGFAAGILAGAVGALAYTLACDEMAPAFVAVWYTLGILLTGALGAALGPKVLRW
jgi:hypothetical protein